MGQLKSQGLFCFASGMIMGGIIGICLFSILVSYRIDTYHKEIAYLETTIQDKDDRLLKLEKKINTQELILKDIEVFLTIEGDEIDRIDIEKAINQKYSSLLGKEVENIDVDIITEVVDKRIMKIEDRTYQLHVVKVVLTETMKIWINVDVYNQT